MKAVIFIHVLYLILIKTFIVKGASKCEPRVELRAVLLSCPAKDTGCDDDDLLSQTIRSEEFQLLQADSKNFDSLREEREKGYSNLVKECKRKLVITLKIKNSGKIPCDDEYIVVDHVFDPITGGRGRLLSPVVLKLRQEQMNHLYGLRFQRVVNSEPFEEQASGQPCSVSPENPTCGIAMYDGKPIPFSEGFCCSCKSHSNAKRQAAPTTLKDSPLYRDYKMIYQGSPHFVRDGKVPIIDPTLIKMKSERAAIDSKYDSNDVCDPPSWDKIPNYLLEHDRKVVCDRGDFMNELCKLQEDKEHIAELSSSGEGQSKNIGRVKNEKIAAIRTGVQVEGPNLKNLKKRIVVNVDEGKENIIKDAQERNLTLLKNFIKTLNMDQSAGSDNYSPVKGSRGKRENRNENKKLTLEEKLEKFVNLKSNLANPRKRLLELSHKRRRKVEDRSSSGQNCKVHMYMPKRFAKCGPPKYFFSHDRHIIDPVDAVAMVENASCKILSSIPFEETKEKKFELKEKNSDDHCVEKLTRLKNDVENPKHLLEKIKSSQAKALREEGKKTDTEGRRMHDFDQSFKMPHFHGRDAERISPLNALEGTDPRIEDAFISQPLNKPGSNDNGETQKEEKPSRLSCKCIKNFFRKCESHDKNGKSHKIRNFFTAKNREREQLRLDLIKYHKKLDEDSKKNECFKCKSVKEENKVKNEDHEKNLFKQEEKEEKEDKNMEEEEKEQKPPNDVEEKQDNYKLEDWTEMPEAPPNKEEKELQMRKESEQLRKEGEQMRKEGEQMRKESEQMRKESEQMRKESEQMKTAKIEKVKDENNVCDDKNHGKQNLEKMPQAPASDPTKDSMSNSDFSFEIIRKTLPVYSYPNYEQNYKNRAPNVPMSPATPPTPEVETYNYNKNYNLQRNRQNFYLQQKLPWKYDSQENDISPVHLNFPLNEKINYWENKNHYRYFKKPESDAEHDLRYDPELGLYNLRRPDLGRLDLERSDLGRLDLEKSDLGRLDLEKSDLGRLDLEKSDLGRLDLERSDLKKLDLERSDLGRLDLERSDLGRLDLEKSDLGRLDLERSDLKKLDLERSDLGRLDLERSDPKRLDLEKSDLGRLDLERSDLKKLDLERSDLGRLDLERSDLKRLDLERSDLGRSDLGRPDLGRPDLGRPDLGVPDLILNSELESYLQKKPFLYRHYPQVDQIKYDNQLGNHEKTLGGSQFRGERLSVQRRFDNGHVKVSHKREAFEGSQRPRFEKIRNKRSSSHSFQPGEGLFESELDSRSPEDRTVDELESCLSAQSEKAKKSEKVTGRVIRQTGRQSTRFKRENVSSDQNGISNSQRVQNEQSGKSGINGPMVSLREKSIKAAFDKQRLIQSYLNAPDYVLKEVESSLKEKRQTSRSNSSLGGSGEQEPSETAHCMRFSDMWYSLYTISKPTVSQTVGIQLFDKHLLWDGSSEWRDLTKGKMIRVGTYMTKAEDELPSISVSFRGETPEKVKSAIDPENYYLLIPSHVSAPSRINLFPQFYGGPAEYLLINSKDVSSGGECNMVGTSFEAFAQQPDRCNQPMGSCFKRQPVDLWREDMEARIRGKRGKYFVENFGTVPNSSVKTYTNLTGEYLALEYYGVYTSTIEIEVKADSNAVIRKGAIAQIPLVYIDSTYPKKTRIILSVLNIGLTSSLFRPRLGDCPPNLDPAWCPLEGPLVTIPPQQRHDFKLDLSGALPSRQILLSVQVLNQKNKVIASRRVDIRRGDRCVCAFHCKCNCIGNSGDDRTCRRLSLKDYRKAGYIGSFPFRGGGSGSSTKNFFKNVYIVLLTASYILLLLGVIKGILGIFVRRIGIAGVKIITGPRQISRYYESELQTCSVLFDEYGFPVHPTTCQPVQILPLWVETIVNVFFFFIYPLKGLWFLLLSLPCCQVICCECENCARNYASESDQKSSRPLLSKGFSPTCVHYNLTTVNSKKSKQDEFLPYPAYKGDDDPLEEDDTEFVLQEMKRYRIE